MKALFIFSYDFFSDDIGANTAVTVAINEGLSRDMISEGLQYRSHLSSSSHLY
jgi:hypothetical protein